MKIIALDTSKMCITCEDLRDALAFSRADYKMDRAYIFCHLCTQTDIQRKDQRQYTEKQRENKAKYASKRRQSDPLFKITNTLRTTCRRTRVKFNLKISTNTLLGCSFKFAYAFLRHTAILNYGIYSEEIDYQVDHVIPFWTASTPEEAISLTHITNLQFLLTPDNRAKGGKLDWFLPDTYFTQI